MARTARTFTARQQRTELAGLTVQINAVDTALLAFAPANFPMAGPVSDEVGAAWNALHDAQTALRAQFRHVGLNPLVGATADLVAANRD